MSFVRAPRRRAGRAVQGVARRQCSAWFATFALSIAGCASSHGEKTAPSQPPGLTNLGSGSAENSGSSRAYAGPLPPGSGPWLAGTGPVPAGTTAALPVAGTGGFASAADSSRRECRGPGVYGVGKESPHVVCCDGLYDASLRYAGHDQNNLRMCDPPLDGSYACIRGKCGDGVCEVEEDVACGCAEDCPGAAWEGTDAISASAANGFPQLPASCSKPDLVASLQTSEGAIDCGDLPVEASTEAKASALQCARDALDASKPFSLFWSTYGTDSLNHTGVVARLETGVLHVYSVQLVAANSFGSVFKGENASWSECEEFGSSSCTDQPDDCLRCASPSDTYCICAPASELPGTPSDATIGLQCKRAPRD